MSWTCLLCCCNSRSYSFLSFFPAFTILSYYFWEGKSYKIVVLLQYQPHFAMKSYILFTTVRARVKIQWWIWVVFFVWGLSRDLTWYRNQFFRFFGAVEIFKQLLFSRRASKKVHRLNTLYSLPALFLEFSCYNWLNLI